MVRVFEPRYHVRPALPANDTLPPPSSARSLLTLLERRPAAVLGVLFALVFLVSASVTAIFVATR